MFFGNDLKAGQIGTLLYYIEETIPMSQEQRQYIIDQDAKAAMYALIQSAALNPNQGYVDVQSEYEKARRQGSERAEQLQKRRVTKKTFHQVGQTESIDEIYEIEKNPNFRGWHDPDLVSYLLTFREE